MPFAQQKSFYIIDIKTFVWKKSLLLDWPEWEKQHFIVQRAA